MFNNMKLGTKISGGFAVVLVLTAIIGFVGYNSLSTVSLEAMLTDDASILRANVLEARRQEKNYIMRHDEKSLDKWNEAIAHINEVLAEIRDNVDSAEDIKEVEEAASWAEKYKETADDYAKAARKHSEKDMVQNGRAFIAICEGLRQKWTSEVREILSSGTDVAALKAKIEVAEDINRLVRETLELRRQEKNYIIRRDDKSVANLNKAFTEFSSLLAGIKKRMETAENREAVDGAASVTKQYKEAFDQYVAMTGELAAAEKRMAGNADHFLEICEQIHKEQKSAMESAVATAIMLIMVIGVGAIIFGAAIAWFIVRGITRPVNRIIEGLTSGAEQTASAAGQVSGSSQSLAEGASEQAAGIEETSSSLEEMSSMTKQNAANAQQANTLAKEARASADNGNEAMGRMTTAIEDIRKSSDETSKIIKTIDEIAFQTNLLALNAAVEAARAGEAGKGFAVVAEEVRNLAQRSAESAKTTSDLIGGSVKHAENGVKIASDVAKSLEEITEGVRKVDELIGEITAASNEQSQGIDQINTAVTQMDQVTQQNAANAEESAAASEELSAQAEQMQGIVGDLTRLVEGGSADRKIESASRNSTATKRPAAKRPAPAAHMHLQAEKAEDVIPLEEEDVMMSKF